MGKQQELVSIIVPVYGTEDYLPACLDSICKQSYPHIQIILVDDGSQDGCPEICDQYARMDPRILVIHQKNKGVSGARNTGINHATGTFLMFVDSDDKLYPKAVETMLQDAYVYQADIVWAPRKNENMKRDMNCDSVPDSPTIYREDASLLMSLNGAYNINAVWGKLFRAEFVEGILFDEGRNINEDGFYMFQCYMRRPVLVKHNICLYRYNSRPDSCSRQAFSDKYLSMLFFCERKKDLIAANYPQYMEHANNMEVRTNLQMLQLLCSTREHQYRMLQKQCIQTVRKLYGSHRPINDAHRKLAWMVRHGLYPIYRAAVRIKYYR